MKFNLFTVCVATGLCISSIQQNSAAAFSRFGSRFSAFIKQHARGNLLGRLNSRVNSNKRLFQPRQLSFFQRFGLLSAASALAFGRNLAFAQKEEQISQKSPLFQKTDGVVPVRTKSFLPNDRPSEVQEAIDKAFEKNSGASEDAWLYRGAYGFYGILELDERLLLKRLAVENPKKQDIYIIDVGCARGKWGKEAMNALLEYEADKPSGKRFHIFSVTGGKECDEVVVQQNNVTLYQLNQFKIENIDQEFAKRGFDLKDKVALIVSRWTLRHLVDPFGTLKRMYGLLAPAQGKLLSNAFFFMFSDSHKVEAFPRSNEFLLTHTNAVPLFRCWDSVSNAGQFLLVRNSKDELEIPLQYAGVIQDLGSRFQNASQQVTVFNRALQNKPDFEREYIEESEHEHYCDRNDPSCKNLYAKLASKKLFYEGWSKNAGL